VIDAVETLDTVDDPSPSNDEVALRTFPPRAVIGIAEDDGTLDPSVMVVSLAMPEVESTTVEPLRTVVVTDTVSPDDETIIFDEDEILVVGPGTAELEPEFELTTVLLVTAMVERLEVCMAVSTLFPEIVDPVI